MKTVLVEWERRISRSIEGHYETSKLFKKRDNRLTILIISSSILLCSTSVDAITTEFIVSDSMRQHIYTALSLILLIGALYQIFQNYNIRHVEHKESASKYAIMRRNIELCHCNDNLSIDELRDITKQINELSNISPSIPDNIWGKVKKKYSTFTSKTA